MDHRAEDHRVTRLIRDLTGDVLRMEVSRRISEILKPSEPDVLTVGEVLLIVHASPQISRAKMTCSIGSTRVPSFVATA